MNKQENINKIKESLKALFTFSETKQVFVAEGDISEIQTVEVKLETVKLEDGTPLNIDKMEVGGIVTLEDGTLALAGEYKLEDGTVLVIGEAGVIADIKKMDETPVEEAQIENAEVVETPEVETETEEVESEDKMLLLEERISKLEAMIAEMTMSNEEMKKQVAEFAAQPADEAVTVERKFSTVDKSDVKAEILKLRARAKKVNDNK